MKTKLTLAAATLLLFAILAFAAAKKLAGNWTGSVTTPNGDIPLSYTFKTDGQKLTGTLTGPQGTVDIDSGVYKDSMLSFSISGMQGNVIHQTGKFYGDSVAINFQIMGNPIHVKLLRAN
jgi:hypothetical protein